MKAQQTPFLWPMDQMTSTKVLKCIKTNVAQVECIGPYITLGVTDKILPEPAEATIDYRKISNIDNYWPLYQTANIDHYWPLCHAFQPSLAIIGMALMSQIHIELLVT
ncbi:hypothetical protein ACJW30_07G020700 [Castanea mollissima]